MSRNLVLMPTLGLLISACGAGDDPTPDIETPDYSTASTGYAAAGDDIANGATLSTRGTLVSMNPNASGVVIGESSGGEITVWNDHEDTRQWFVSVDGESELTLTSTVLELASGQGALLSYYLPAGTDELVFGYIPVGFSTDPSYISGLTGRAEYSGVANLSGTNFRGNYEGFTIDEVTFYVDFDAVTISGFFEDEEDTFNYSFSEAEIVENGFSASLSGSGTIAGLGLISDGEVDGFFVGNEGDGLIGNITLTGTYADDSDNSGTFYGGFAADQDD